MANDHRKRSVFSASERIDIYNSLVNGEPAKEIAKRYNCAPISIYQSKRAVWFRKYKESYEGTIPQDILLNVKLAERGVEQVEHKSILRHRGKRLTPTERLDIFTSLVVNKQSAKEVGKRYGRSEASIFQMKNSNWFYDYKRKYSAGVPLRVMPSASKGSDSNEEFFAS